MKRILIAFGALSVTACAEIPSEPVGLGDGVYTMRTGYLTSVQAIENGNKFCKDQGKRYKFIRDNGSHIRFACLADNEHLEFTSPTQKMQVEVR